MPRNLSKRLSSLLPYTRPEPVAVTIPSTRKPKRVYADAPVESEPISVPVTPLRARLCSEHPAAVTVPSMSAALST